MACDSQVNICLADASGLMQVAMLLVILGWIYVLGWVVLELAKKLAIPPSLLANWAAEEATEDYWATRTRLTEEDWADYAYFKAQQACIAELEARFAAERAEQLPAPPAAAPPPTLLARLINMLQTMSEVLTEEADRGFKALAEARAEVLEWIARALTEDADDADDIAADGAKPARSVHRYHRRNPHRPRS